MFIVFTNAFHTVNNLRLKLQAAETGPSAPKNYAQNAKRHALYVKTKHFHLPTDIYEMVPFTPPQVICSISFFVFVDLLPQTL